MPVYSSKASSLYGTSKGLLWCCPGKRRIAPKTAGNVVLAIKTSAVAPPRGATFSLPVDYTQVRLDEVPSQSRKGLASNLPPSTAFQAECLHGEVSSALSKQRH